MTATPGWVNMAEKPIAPYSIDKACQVIKLMARGLTEHEARRSHPLLNDVRLNRAIILEAAVWSLAEAETPAELEVKYAWVRTFPGLTMSLQLTAYDVYHLMWNYFTGGN